MFGSVGLYLLCAVLFLLFVYSRALLYRSWWSHPDCSIHLMQYAERRGYILAAVYGETPYDTHYYYVRPDFPDAAAIVQRIRSTRYIWYQTGRPCINYALLEPKAPPKEP